ncbi:hypothetical protein NL676_029916 [Syzygium grande]|nr:hypothetical protein NL676_029916 [Syzygium grande]
MSSAHQPVISNCLLWEIRPVSGFHECPASPPVPSSGFLDINPEFEIFQHFHTCGPGSYYRSKSLCVTTDLSRTPDIQNRGSPCFRKKKPVDSDLIPLISGVSTCVLDLHPHDPPKTPSHESPPRPHPKIPPLTVSGPTSSTLSDPAPSAGSLVCHWHISSQQQSALHDRFTTVNHVSPILVWFCRNTWLPPGE